MSWVNRKLKNLPSPTGYNPPELTLVRSQPDAQPKANLRLRMFLGAAIFLVLTASLGMKYYKLLHPAQKPTHTLSEISEMLNHGEYAAAISALKLYIDESPKDTTAWIDMAFAYKGIGKPADAEEILKGVISFSPTEPSAHNNLGRIEAAKGNWKAAIKEYKTALELRPTYGEAIINLAYAYEATQNWLAAKDLYEKFLSVDKANTTIHPMIRRRLRILQAFESYQLNHKDRS